MASIWSKTFGKYGNRVRVYEIRPGSSIYMAEWDAANDKPTRRSLGHKDKDRAEEQAQKLAGERQRLGSAIATARLTVGALLDQFVEAKGPMRKDQKQRNYDSTHNVLWGNVLGRDFYVDRISRREMDRFAHERYKGLIDARGNKNSGKGVARGSVLHDIRWLYTACEWATETTRQDSSYLLDINPLKRLIRALARQWKEPTPKRPIASQDWYNKVAEVANQIDGYLENLLPVVGGTGRRIASVRHLKASDFIPPDKESPFGSLKWRSQFDKRGYEMQVPITQDVANALQRQLNAVGAIGEAWIFPNPRDPFKPITYRRTWLWLLQAEKLAGLEHQKRFGWHGLRRQWATARKHLPVADVAKVGGWKDHAVLQSIYQSSDAEGRLRAALGQD